MSLPAIPTVTITSSISLDLSNSISNNVSKSIESNQDLINLSPEAKVHLQNVNDAAKVLIPLSSQEKETLYEKKAFSAYNLNSKYQPYADIINNKNSTDQQN